MVYSEHFLEHLDDSAGRRFIEESFRVLKQGGVFSVVVPDAGRAVQEYVAGGGPLLSQLKPFHGEKATLFDQLNHIFHQGDQHRWLYDPDTLRLRLIETGFRDVHERQFDPQLDFDFRAFESLYFDAVK